MLFNGLPENHPRLLFKGGTSLSKSVGLINRFSEDIDITVFRNDLGEPASIEELEALSGKKRRVRLDAIKAACQAFINGAFRQQTLLFWYPAVTTAPDDYIRSAVKIEAGAKSALDPNVPTTVEPYVAEDLPDFDLKVTGITTVEPQPTFWDKVVILHRLRRWYDRRGELRHGGQRVSRHYFDVFRLLQAPLGETAEADRVLAVDCARHARMFFNNPDFDLDHAVPGTLAPSPTMLEPLERDYDAMAGMIMGTAPPFADVIDVVSALERRLNESE